MNGNLQLGFEGFTDNSSGITKRNYCGFPKVRLSNNEFTRGETVGVERLVIISFLLPHLCGQLILQCPHFS